MNETQTNRKSGANNTLNAPQLLRCAFVLFETVSLGMGTRVRTDTRRHKFTRRL